MKTKEQRFKKIGSVLLTFLLIFSVLTPGIVSQAAATPYLYPESKTTVYYRTGDYYNNEVISFINFPKNGKVTKLKVKNSKIAKVSFNKKGKYFVVTPKRSGKTSFSFRLTYGKKSKNFKYTLTVKKAPNPMKTFKIGSKSIASKFNNKSIYNLKITKSGKQRVSIKPRSGWSIYSIEFMDYRYKTKKMKNNSQISLKKGRNSRLYVVFKEKKTGRIDGVSVYMR